MAEQPTLEDPDAPIDPDLEQALEWLVLLHSGDVPADALARYHAWAASAPQRGRAARQAELLWGALGPASRPLRGPRLAKAVVSVVLVALIGTMAWAANVLDRPGAYLADQRTGTGERHSLTLPDGSHVEMDARTALDVEYDGTRRRIVLVQGRIHVQVRPDPTRPFDVEAADGVIRALGTAFDVERTQDRVSVTVTEHAVSVAYAGRAAPHMVTVEEGRGVSFDPSQGLGSPQKVKVSEAEAWRQGLMLFDGLRLGDVLAQLQRYRSGMVVVTDPVLRDLPVTGIFASDDKDGILHAIAETLPVQVYQLPGLTVIRPVQKRLS